MVSGHSCANNTADARLYVNGTRLPLADCDIHIRKEGPTSLTRYVEGTFPSPFENVDYVDAFDALQTDTQNGYDALRIDIRDHNDETFRPAFRGYVTGLGNSSGPERIWTFRAQGLGLFIDKIRATKRLSGVNGIKAKTVTNYIVGEIARQFGSLPFDFGSDVNSNKEKTNRKQRVPDGKIFGGTDVLALVPKTIPQHDIRTTKNFKPNRHTLADVIDWFEKKFNVRTWFEYDEGTVLLLATQFPNAKTIKAHYLGGNLHVIRNDALTELKPVNTLIGRGSAKASSNPVKEFIQQQRGTEYAQVKAVHQELYERAGNTELLADDIEVDAKSTETVVNEVTNRLKKEIDSATSGDMITLPRVPIQPFDIIKAKPTCSGSPATDVDPLTYEVHRVHHRIRGGEQSTTKLNVGVYTRQSDIRTTTKYKEV